MRSIDIKKLSFAYDRQQILTDVDLTIDKGEFVGLIGPNGGGKTTLLKLLLGFLKPDSGSIELLGHAPDEAREMVGYVPQNLRYDQQFPLTVLDLVLSGRLRRTKWFGRYSANDRKAARQALHRVDMCEHEDRPFSELSGGQAQRALIARALASEPQMLLLDEPTANVDAQAEASIYALLKELKGSMTIVMVTHDFDVAVDLVDRVVCVQNRVDTLERQQVCDHFAMGIYHAPIGGSDQ